MKYVSAHTAFGGYPPFINFSRDDKVMRVLLRSGERDKEQFAQIDIPLDEWRKMLAELVDGSR